MDEPAAETSRAEWTEASPYPAGATEPTSAAGLPTSASDPSPTASPLTDSPLFWLALFGLFGLAALLVVGPKYALRQGGIETRFQNRQVAGQWQGQKVESEQAIEAARLPVTPGVRNLLIPLAPLFAILGVAVAMLAVGLIWRRCKPSSHDANQQP